MKRGYGDKGTQTISDYLRSKGYQTCEYITSTGTQYIDTGYSPISGFKIEAKFSSSVTYQTGNYATFFGSERASVPYRNVYTRMEGRGTQGILGITACMGSIPTRTYIDKSLLSIEMKNDLSEGYVISNGTKYQRDNVETPSGNNIVLFADNVDGSIERYTSAKFYRFKFWINKGNELVRDFYPVYNVASGVSGLYDIVSDSFFGNKGRGAFTHGPDIEIE